MKKKVFGVVLLALCLGFTKYPKPHSDFSGFQKIISVFSDQIHKDLDDDGIGGSMSVAIIKGDSIVWSKAFGYADRSKNSYADTNTIYRIGSITKSFTAFLMMELVDEGVMKLTDPVELYVPEIKDIPEYSKKVKITCEQLASHSAGLSREPKLKNADSGSIALWESKVLASIPTISFESNPGTRFLYSNIGYAILGLALSRASKKPYIDLVEEKILRPLGMKNTFFIIPGEEKTRLAKGMEGGPFEKLNTKTPETENEGRGYKVPNGGIYSTPNDLAKFVMALMGYQSLIRKETLQIMETQQTQGDENYGFGLELVNDKQADIIEHDGSVAGYTAQFAFDKNSKYGVIIFRNYNWGVTDLTMRSQVLLRDLNRLKDR